MNSKKSLFTIPITSTSLTADAFGEESFDGFLIRLEYREGERSVRAFFKFHGFLALRRRTEICSSVWNIDGCYDTLVEVESSDWLAEIEGSISPRLRSQVARVLKHYMIYLDSVGCFEVIAEGWVFEKQYVSSD